MNTNQTRNTGSNLEAQIRSINLSDRERNAALQAANIAEVVVGVFLQIASKVSRQARSAYAKPQLN